MPRFTVTHIAGLDINAFGRIVQRCALCGVKLCDSKGAMAPAGPDGTTPDFPTFTTGRLVQVTVGQNPTRYLVLDETDRLPDDSCIDLVED